MQEKTINEPGRKDGEKITKGPLLVVGEGSVYGDLKVLKNTY